MKLSLAQKRVLQDVMNDCGRYSCSDSYAPALKLSALGLCESEPQAFGTMKLTITDKGVVLITGNSKS